MTRVSASSVERAIACPASVFLPSADESTVYAERGNDVDGYVRRVLTGVPRDTALAAVKVAETRATCERIDFRKLGGDLTDVRCQVAYVVDVRARTARVLGEDIGRAYAGLGPWDVPGTLDIEGMRPDSAPVVLDVKSGYHEVSPAEENGQLRTYAAARMLTTGASEVEKRVAYVRASGKVWLDVHTDTSLEIDGFLDEVEDGLARIDRERAQYAVGGTTDVHPGPHCRFCPAMHACPAKHALAKTMVGGLTDVAARVASLTLPEAGKAWRLTDEAGALVDTIRGALKLRAAAEPLPLGDDKVVRAIQFERESFDRGAALGLLKTLGATEEQIAALYDTAMVEQIRETRDPNAPAKPRARKTKAA